MSKQDVLQEIASLPDDVSFDDVLYHLYVVGNIEQGLNDLAKGRSFTHEQVKEMFAN